MTRHTTTTDPAPRPARAHTTLAVIAACAVVITAHLLGIAWLSETVWGVPAGLWIVPAWVALAWLISPKDRAELPGNLQSQPTPLPIHVPSPAPALAAIPRHHKGKKGTRARAATDEPPAPALAITRPGAHGPILRSSWNTSGLKERACALASRAAGTLCGDRAGEWLDDHGPGVRPLVVGLRISRDVGSAVRGAGDTADVRWVTVNEGGEAGEVCRRLGLDALVTDGENQGLCVVTPERAGREAAWFDWGGPRPLSYFSVFPMRVDAARATLAGQSAALYDRPGSAGEVLRALITAAGLLSRHPRRLSAADRLMGRVSSLRAVDGVEPAWEGMTRLAEAVSAWGESAGSASRVGARVSTAWLASAAVPAGVDRVALMESSSIPAADEPEVLLRLGAVRIAMGDEGLGIDAILRADRLLRDRGVVVGVDPVTLIQAEMEHGTFGELTVGRVAAGICLACSKTPADRIGYVKEDLLEDMRFASWLVGRDPERTTLIEVFRRLERARRSEVFGLPKAA
ncbi:MAG: hypothetical protein HRU70_08355 [Phycisphaeraceae bacterium]|nr:MAG: hypothetical protein HRU70_08355 [Phycisphaeraceae bacterium]